MKKGAGLLVSQVKQLSDRVFNALLREYDLDLTGSQGRILYILWKAAPMTMSELGTATGLANNTLTVVVENMQAEGWVLRTRDPADRRRQLVALTPKAQAAEGRYQEVSEKMTRLYFEGFTENEVAALESALERLLANLQKAETTQEEEHR